MLSETFLKTDLYLILYHTVFLQTMKIYPSSFLAYFVADWE